MPGVNFSEHRSLEPRAAERIVQVNVDDDFVCAFLADGRVIAVPLTWYPRLLHATREQRLTVSISAGGYGLHWPELDEDLSVEGMLRGAPAPAPRAVRLSEPIQEAIAESAAFAVVRRQARLWVNQMILSGQHSSVFPVAEFQAFQAGLVEILRRNGFSQEANAPQLALGAAFEEAQSEWRRHRDGGLTQR